MPAQRTEWTTDVLRRIGELYAAAGQRDEARRAWNQLLTLWRKAEGPAALEVKEIEKLVAR